MKTAHILVVSLAMNAALIAAGAYYYLNNPEETQDFSGEPAAGPLRSAQPVPGGHSSGAIVPSVASEREMTAGDDEAERAIKVRPDDYRELVAALEEEGWSEEEARTYAFGAMMTEFFRHAIAIQGGRGEYWKQESYAPSWEEQRVMMEMSVMMQSFMEDVVGEEASGLMGGMTSLSFLSPDKRRAAQLIEMDYSLMQSSIHGATQGVMLPEDREMLALIREEQRRDLEELLTPDELFEYDVRNAHGLRQRLQFFEPTEEEFRALFVLEAGGNDEASGELEEGVRELLGDQRFQQYQRSSDWAYRQLGTVVNRLELPAERIDEVYDVKQVVEARQRELATDQNLSNEERQEQLQALQEETRATVAELLGEQGVEVYQNHGGNWMRIR